VHIAFIFKLLLFLYDSALPPNEDGMWDEEEVNKVAEEVKEYFKIPQQAQETI